MLKSTLMYTVSIAALAIGQAAVPEGGAMRRLAVQEQAKVFGGCWLSESIFCPAGSQCDNMTCDENIGGCGESYEAVQVNFAVLAAITVPPGTGISTFTPTPPKSCLEYYYCTECVPLLDSWRCIPAEVSTGKSEALSDNTFSGPICSESVAQLKQRDQYAGDVYQLRLLAKLNGVPVSDSLLNP